MNPHILFLSETKNNREAVTKLVKELRFGGSQSVFGEGNSGGLSLLWREEVNISINSSSIGHIDATIKEELGWWRFTGFYGNLVTYKREESWKLLKRLNAQTELP